jgi:hypothetical protein
MVNLIILDPREDLKINYLFKCLKNTHIHFFENFNQLNNLFKNIDEYQNVAFMFHQSFISLNYIKNINKTFDILSCNFKPSQKIDNIRYSSKKLGYGYGFNLDSHNINVQDIYFNENINNWKTVLSSGWVSNDNNYTTNVSSGVWSYEGSASLNINGSTIKGTWVLLKSPESIKINKYGIAPLYPSSSNNNPYRQPRRWYLVGSHDKVNWQIISHQSSDYTGFETSDNYQVIKYFNVSSSNYYTYHAILFTHVSDADSNKTFGTVDLSKLEIYGSGENLGFKYPPVGLTKPEINIDNENYGNGKYILSYSSINSSNADDAFDDLNNNTAWISNTGYNSTTGTSPGEALNTYNNMPSKGEYLEIELPERIKLLYYRIRPRNVIDNYGNPIQWYILASDDKVNWTQLDRITLSSSDYLTNNETQTGFYIKKNNESLFKLKNDNYKKYYRILIDKIENSNTDVDFVSIGELELYGMPVENKLYQYPPEGLKNNNDSLVNQDYGNGEYNIIGIDEFINSNFSGFYSWYDNASTTQPSSTDPKFYGTGSSGTNDNNGYYLLKDGITSSYQGNYHIISLPHSIKPLFIYISSNSTERLPLEFRIYGSKDKIKWDIVKDVSLSVSDWSNKNITLPLESKKYYKYFGMVVNRVDPRTDSNACYYWLKNIKYYGIPEDLKLEDIN